MRACQSIPPHLHLAHTPLPDPGPSLAVHAHDMVELSAWLLASCGGALMSVILCPHERDAAMPATVWNRDRLPDKELSRIIAAPAHRFRPVLGALEGAATDLFEALSPRWPPCARPHGLGVVTDGTGLGFCPDDPSPLAPGWMSRRARNGNRLTCLLPFSPQGAWQGRHSLSA